MNMKSILQFMLCALVMVTVSACSMGGANNGRSTGKIAIKFVDKKTGKTVAAAIPTNVDTVTLDVTPVAPAGPASPATDTQTAASIASMISSTGDWGFQTITTDDNQNYVFSVSARDINGNLVYTGSTTQFMQPGNNTVTITCTPYVVTGNNWVGKTAMTTPRAKAASAQVNGKIYVIGGEIISGGSPFAVNTVEEYDPATNAWTTRAPMPTQRRYHAVAAWQNIIYVFGGEDSTGTPIASVHAYNPQTNTWSTPVINGGTFTARARLAAVAFNGSIYTIGGTDAGGGTSLTTVEIFDPSAGTWVAGPSLNIPRARMSAIIARDASTGSNIISVKGGEEVVSTPVATQELLGLSPTPAPNWVVSAASLPAERSRHGAVVAGTSGYIVGGVTTGSVLTNVVWRYDLNNPAATFQTVASLPTIRNYPVVESVDGKVYVIGGTDGTNALATVEEYTPAGSLPKIGTPIQTSSLVTVNEFIVNGNKAVIFGQQVANGTISYQDITINPFGSIAAPVDLGITPVDPVDPEINGAVGGGVYAIVTPEANGVWFRTIASPNPGAAVATTQIANFAANASISPQIAFDGTNFLVVWNDLGGVISGQFVSPAGALVGGSFVITSGINIQKLVFGGGSYLLIAASGGAGVVVDGIGITPAGAVSAVPAPIIDLPAATDWNDVNAVYNGSTFVVVASIGDVNGKNIFANAVQVNGTTVLPGNNLIQGTTGTGTQRHSVDISWDGFKWLVSWEEQDALGNLYVYSRNVGYNATFMGPAVALTGSLGAAGGNGGGATFWAPSLNTYLLGSMANPGNTLTLATMQP